MVRYRDAGFSVLQNVHGSERYSADYSLFSELWLSLSMSAQLNTSLRQSQNAEGGQNLEHELNPYLHSCPKASSELEGATFATSDGIVLDRTTQANGAFSFESSNLIVNTRSSITSVEHTPGLSSTTREREFHSESVCRTWPQTLCHLPLATSKVLRMSHQRLLHKSLQLSWSATLFPYHQST